MVFFNLNIDLKNKKKYYLLLFIYNLINFLLYKTLYVIVF